MSFGRDPEARNASRSPPVRFPSSLQRAQIATDSESPRLSTHRKRKSRPIPNHRGYQRIARIRNRPQNRSSAGRKQLDLGELAKAPALHHWERFRKKIEKNRLRSKKNRKSRLRSKSFHYIFWLISSPLSLELGTDQRPSPRASAFDLYVGGDRIGNGHRCLAELFRRRFLNFQHFQFSKDEIIENKRICW